MRAQPSETELTTEQQEAIESLEAIGYSGGTTEAVASGVTLHFESRAHAGLNFYTSGHAPEAVLMDMNGNVLHRWERGFREIWPESKVGQEIVGTQWWRRAHLFENGDILAIFEGQGIVKLNSASEVLWAKPVLAHHDLEVMPNGEIFMLGRIAHVVPRIHPNKPILEDFVWVLDADGKLLRKFSLLEALEKSDFAAILKTRMASLWKRGPGDIFHTNSLSVLKGRRASEDPAFAEGNLLISMRMLDAIAIVDPAQQKIVWLHTGDFIGPHDPKLLESGTMLVFDNGEPNRGDSKVMEFDPVTLQKVWEYRESEDSPFFSMSCGTAERMPNKNTLITESDNGRALEVTPSGEIVWEFYNPSQGGDSGQFIAVIAELLRLPLDFPTDWADGKTP